MRDAKVRSQQPPVLFASLRSSSPVRHDVHDLVDVHHGRDVGECCSESRVRHDESVFTDRMDEVKQVMSHFRMRCEGGYGCCT